MNSMLSRGRVLLRAITVVVLAVLAGCAGLNSIGKAIDEYAAVAPTVKLGQDKASVLAVLEPTQQGLSVSQRKAPEQFTKDDKLTEIYFYRSSTVSDGLVTDDEFTPYVFEDGKLVGIGWTLIGGPKTQGQTREEPANVRFYGRFWL